MISSNFVIETNKTIGEVESALRLLEPWRIGIQFSNGFDTSSLKTMQPWNSLPLNKLKTIMEYAGENIFRAARVLDIGFNAGYNSITLSQSYGADVVGIDNNRLNLQKALALSKLAGVSPKFIIADATDYTEEPFDIVLHLGTLYHLQDPIKSMRTAAKNTKPGGHLFLETTGYDGSDPLDGRLIYGFGGDKTNYWALGTGAVELILTDAGFKAVELIRTYEVKIFEGTGLNRTLFHAEK